MRRVIKLGGSLLLRKDLAAQTVAWLARQKPAANWILIGGGSTVDALRKLDQVHHFDQHQLHWKCIELMKVTTSLAREIFPHWQYVASSADLAKLIVRPDQPREMLIDVAAFYGVELNNQLPCTWETTSDAIAAFLAGCIRADELVLLKSCEIDPGHSFTDLVASGVVDPVCGQLVANLSAVRVVTLAQSARLAPIHG